MTPTGEDLLTTFHLISNLCAFAGILTGFDTNLKLLTIGTFSTDKAVLHYMGQSSFLIPLDDHHQIEFKSDDIKKMEQNFSPGNNFCRFNFRPQMAKQIESLLPEGLRNPFLPAEMNLRYLNLFSGNKFVCYSKNIQERTFIMQFHDDLEENVIITLANVFSSVDPILEGVIDPQGDAPEDPEVAIEFTSEVQHSNGLKTKAPKGKDDEFAPKIKKMKKPENGNGSEDAEPKRYLRSRSRVKYNERETSDYYADDNSIPEQLRHDIPEYLIDDPVDSNGAAGSSTKDSPARTDLFAEYENSIELCTYHDIVIRMEDFKCLDYRELVNNVILDFYFQYIYHEKLTEAQRQSIHIYNTAFYNLYSTKTNYAGWNDDENKHKPAMHKRYERVRDLPSNCETNIFEKDFIVFPCLFNNHWFLTIACYPKLNGSVTVDGERPVVGEMTRRDMRNPNAGEPLKTSCILVLDSVKDHSGRRNTAVRHIRNFLSSDHLEKYQNDFPFDPSCMTGNCPKVGNIRMTSNHDIHSFFFF